MLISSSTFSSSNVGPDVRLACLHFASLLDQPSSWLLGSRTHPLTSQPFRILAIFERGVGESMVRDPSRRVSSTSASSLTIHQNYLLTTHLLRFIFLSLIELLSVLIICNYKMGTFYLSIIICTFT